jgi:hypothetical protein
MERRTFFKSVLGVFSLAYFGSLTQNPVNVIPIYQTPLNFGMQKRGRISLNDLIYFDENGLATNYPTNVCKIPIGRCLQECSESTVLVSMRKV